MMDVRTRGFAVLAGVHDAAACEEMRRALERLWVAAGRPALSGDGFVVRSLLGRAPELARCFVAPALVEAMRAVLADEVRLEVTAAILSDPSRGFFPWHAHVGGIDQDLVRSRLGEMQLSRLRRLSCLFYPGGCDELLVLPRAVGNPLTPPFADTPGEQPGQVVVTCAPGDVVVCDEALYHAVRRQTRPGLRHVVGAYYVARSEPPAEERDASLDDPAVRALLGPGI